MAQVEQVQTLVIPALQVVAHAVQRDGLDARVRPVELGGAAEHERAGGDVQDTHAEGHGRQMVLRRETSGLRLDDLERASQTVLLRLVAEALRAR